MRKDLCYLLLFYIIRSNMISFSERFKSIANSLSSSAKSIERNHVFPETLYNFCMLSRQEVWDPDAEFCTNLDTGEFEYLKPDKEYGYYYSWKGCTDPNNFNYKESVKLGSYEGNGQFFSDYQGRITNMGRRLGEERIKQALRKIFQENASNLHFGKGPQTACISYGYAAWVYHDNGRMDLSEDNITGSGKIALFYSEDTVFNALCCTGENVFGGNYNFTIVRNALKLQ